MGCDTDLFLLRGIGDLGIMPTISESLVTDISIATLGTLSCCWISIWNCRGLVW